MKTSTRQWILVLALIVTNLFSASSMVFSSHNIDELKIVARQGCVYSQYNLGVIYHGGIGVAADFKEAIFWFRKAASQGYVDAQMAIAGMYYLGEGLQQDYSEAAKWARKAADQNDAEAQYNLGMMYYAGKGVQQSFREAVNWLKKAAVQDYLNALFDGLVKS